MMESSSLEEEKMIKGRGNIFKLKKEIDGTAYSQKDIAKIFRLKKENKVIKDRMLRDINNIFDNKEEENYYTPVRVSMMKGV